MKSSQRGAFTLVELLVVVAVMALLIAILVPSLGIAREQARRTVCAANLSTIGKGVVTYAAGNGDMLPVLGGTNYGWWWDMPIDGTVPSSSSYAGMADAIINAPPATTNFRPQSVRRVWYCPSNQDQNAAVGTVDNNGTIVNCDLWDYPGFRVTGYAYFGARQVPASGFIPLPPTLPETGAAPGGGFGVLLRPPMQIYHRYAAPRAPGNMPLAADAIISNTNTPTVAASYVNVQGVFSMPHASSHMGRNGPTGSVVLYYDGHAKWVPWAGPRKAEDLVGSYYGQQNFPWFWVPQD